MESTLSKNDPNDITLGSRYIEIKSSVILANGNVFNNARTVKKRYKEDIITDTSPIFLNLEESFKNGVIRNK